MYSEAALLEMMRGDADAVRLINELAFCSHVYDDLIDRDKPVDPQSIHRMMTMAFVSIPDNPFYRRHQAKLLPVLATGLLNWRAANEMEAVGDSEELHISHATRYSLADVALLAMVLAGGFEHAAKNARRLRLMAQNDTWSNYAAEHDLA